MADYRETHEVTTNSGESKNSATPWLAFLVGGLLVAVILIFYLNGTFDRPGAEINIKSPVTIDEPRGAQPANPAPAKEPAQPAAPSPAK